MKWWDGIFKGKEYSEDKGAGEYSGSEAVFKGYSYSPDFLVGGLLLSKWMKFDG